ncbi:MAG: hypothetical protein FWE19_00295 [Oscillospiraceae bacterium]|nr:hypothetical protein [Oscillospiraceae bacterium]
MSKSKNKVIAGNYDGYSVSVMFGVVSISHGIFSINEEDGSGTTLSKETVASYEVVTDEHRKSAASGIARGLIGGALLGPVGILAGGLSAKSKGIYQVAIEFHDGKKSLIEVDDKIYKAIIKSCF